MNKLRIVRNVALNAEGDFAFVQPDWAIYQVEEYKRVGWLRPQLKWVVVFESRSFAKCEEYVQYERGEHEDQQAYDRAKAYIPEVVMTYD